LKPLLILSFIVLSFTTCVKAIGRIAEEKYGYQALHVDDKNTLWIGTSNGLFRWKNNSSIRVPLSTTLNVSALFAMNNTVIIGTNSGDLYTYQTISKTLSKIANLHTEIADIQYHNGMIAIATKGNGLVLITSQKIKIFNKKNGLSDNFLYSIKFNQHNELWVSSDRGINIIQPNSEVLECEINNQLPDRLIMCIAKRDSFLFCGTQLGDLCKVNLNDSSIVLFDNSYWQNAQVNDIKLLDRTIAVATEQGAYLFDLNGNLIQTIIDNKSILKIEVDKEANLWFCGNRILLFSYGEQIEFLRSLNGERIPLIHAIYADTQSNLYITPDQGISKFNLISKQIDHGQITSPKALIDITCMYQDEYGKLWVGTSGRGLFQVDTATLIAKHILIDSSVETSGILSITGNKDEVYLSTLNGVWHTSIQTSNYQFKSLEDEYGKKKYYVYHVKIDSKSNIWLATDGQGILKLSNNRLVNFSDEIKIPIPVSYAIEEDSLNQIWFIASTNGLYCYNEDTIVHLTQDNGLSSNDILSIKTYQDKFIIAGSLEGIDLINIDNFTVSKLNFESIFMSQTPEINSITSDNKGRIYLGTDQGILQVYLPSYKQIFVPQAYIEDITVMEKYSNVNKRNFSYDENYFRFNISNRSNTNDPVYYRYKLKGLSENWNNTIDKTAVFPRLNPGEYEFILETSNNRLYHNSSQEKFMFTIHNPFWKETWFIVLALSVFALSFYYYVRFREKGISRVQQLEKEKAIAEFETLKHQVSPHFLFNSFNTLIQVIDEDPEKAIEYTQMLSDFYRSLISYQDVDLVSLEEELILLDSYIYLQKMRFGDSLILDNHYNKSEIIGIEIPPLTLQLLAENAIKHNVVSSTKPLTISIDINPRCIVISNNINLKISKEAGAGIGLKNIKNRFNLFSTQEVEIIQTENKFEIKLPILKS